MAKKKAWRLTPEDHAEFDRHMAQLKERIRERASRGEHGYASSTGQPSPGIQSERSACR